MTSSNLNVAKDASTTNITNRNFAANIELCAQKCPPSKSIKASEAWCGLQSAYKEMEKFSSVFSQVGQSFDRCSGLDLQIKTAKQEIADLKLAHKVNMREHGEKVIEMKEEKAELEKRLENEKAHVTSEADSTLKKKNAAHAREIVELKKTLDTERKNSATLTKDLHNAQMRARTIETELGHSSEQLKGWEHYESMLQVLDCVQFRCSVEKLFTSCRTMCRKYFLRELPEKYFANQILWDKSQHPRDFPIDFLPGNTLTAKQIRMAAALYVIASYLCNTFFKPCYIPESPAAVKKVEEILSVQATTDPKKERLTRALLLSTYTPKERKECIENTVYTTSNDVIRFLSHIGGDDEKFRPELEAFFRKSAELWKDAQFSQKMVEASLKDGDYDDEPPWVPLEDFITPLPSADAPTATKTAPAPSSWQFDHFTLFPRIYVPETDNVIHLGAILPQPTIAAAEQEVLQWKQSRKPKAGREGNGPGGVRRLSVRGERVNAGLKAVNKEPFLEPQTVGTGATALMKGALVQNGNR